MEELWKDVPGYEGLYMASSLGRVKSLVFGDKILRQQINGRYPTVGLYKDEKMTRLLVHRIVGLAFIDNPLGHRCINHKDQTTTNNCVENLEWCTHSYNNTYGTAREKRLANTDFSLRQKKVLQMCKNGDIVRIWDGINLASRETKIERANITACCNGRIKSSGGFIWKYHLEVI